MSTNPSRSKPRALGCLWLVLLGLLTGFIPLARADDGAIGVWQGRYFCAQGETAITLTIRPAKRADGLRALFHFYASPANPRVPEGCFTMSGTYDGDTRQFSLVAGRWLLQPFGFVSVDLTGQLGRTGDRMSGRVLGPLCTSFELRRATTKLPAAPACRDSAAIASLP